MKLEKKVNKLSKRYETQTKHTKLEQNVRKSKKGYKIERKLCETTKPNDFFSFAKQLETLFSYFLQFRETTKTRRNSGLLVTVTYSFVFRETKKKYETVNPSHDTTSTSTSLSAKRMTTSCWLSVIADSELLAF